MLGTAGEVESNSQIMYPLELLHMDIPMLVVPQRLTYISTDTGCSLKVLLEATDDRDGWRVRIKERFDDEDEIET